MAKYLGSGSVRARDGRMGVIPRDTRRSGGTVERTSRLDWEPSVVELLVAWLLACHRETGKAGRMRMQSREASERGPKLWAFDRDDSAKARGDTLRTTSHFVP